MVLNKGFDLSRKGFCIVLSAPSGTGKTSLMKELIKTVPMLHRSISFTTRPPRPKELDGKDYFFVTKAAFEEASQQGKFLERVLLYDHAYATPKHTISPILDKGEDIILCLDVQGMHHLKACFPIQVISIFLVPPSLKALQKRMRNRGDTNQEEVKKRLCEVGKEIIQYKHYDYIIINDDFEVCLRALQNIVHSERARACRVNDYHLS